MMKKFFFRKDYFFQQAYGNLILESYEHLIELRERLFQSFFFSVFIFLFFLFGLNLLSDFILRMIPEVQFFQLSPQDFFFSTLFIGLNFTLVFLFPNFVTFLILFFSPSFLLDEKKVVFPLVSLSLFLSFLSILFCYYVLSPLTFKFFLDFNASNIEPFWSFRDFSNFFFKLLYITILVFQVPILQILGKNLGFWNLEQMVKSWKTVILLSFLVGGIITPSTDPFTQLLISIIICLLYSLGIYISKKL